jgi:hypothetical protein
MIRVVHPGSQIRMLTFYPSRFPDPGVKKAPDPGSGSATLIKGRICNRVRNYFRIRQSKRFRTRPKLDPQHRRIALQVETESTDTSAFDSDEVSDDEEPVPVVSFGPNNLSSIDQVR